MSERDHSFISSKEREKEREREREKLHRERNIYIYIYIYYFSLHREIKPIYTCNERERE